MSARAVTRCELCSSAALETVLDLGSSPPTCNMATRRRAETHYPLALLRCQSCGMVVLSTVVESEQLFPADYPYSSGNSRELQVDFADLAEEIDPRRTDLVVDIGANDGTLLSKFDCRTVGVEPTAQAEKIRGDIWRFPFSSEIAHNIVYQHGTADYVTACNVLAHVEDIDDALKGIRILLGDTGTLYAETHALASVVDGGQWDAVYHEHLRFFEPRTLALALDKAGLSIRSQREIPTHGGSFRVEAVAGPKQMQSLERGYDFSALQTAARETRAALRRMSGPLVGIGATARATTVINYCGLDLEDIGYVAEVSGSDKIGRLIPGTRIPVVDESELVADGTDAILFSWHLADKIVPALRGRNYSGRIFAPLPRLRELD